MLRGEICEKSCKGHMHECVYLNMHPLDVWSSESAHYKNLDICSKASNFEPKGALDGLIVYKNGITGKKACIVTLVFPGVFF